MSRTSSRSTERAAWRAVHEAAISLYEAAEELARIGGDTPFDAVITTLWIDMLRMHGVYPATTASAALIDNGLDSLFKSHQRKPIPRRIRMQVFKRDGYACRSCYTGEDLTIDHVVPVSRGGRDDFENLQTLCLPCNLHKGDKL